MAHKEIDMSPQKGINIYNIQTNSGRKIRFKTYIIDPITVWLQVKEKGKREKEMKSIKEVHFFHIYGFALSIIDWERFLGILIDPNVSDLIQSTGKEVLSIILNPSRCYVNYELTN